MSAINYPLKIEQGATFNLSLTLEDAEGLPIDLTGYTGAGQLRPTVSSNNSYSFEVSFNSPRTDGVVNISMSATATRAIPVGGSSTAERRLTTYVYDIELTSPDGTVFRIFEGQVKVSPEVTR